MRSASEKCAGPTLSKHKLSPPSAPRSARWRTPCSRPASRHTCTEGAGQRGAPNASSGQPRIGALGSRDEVGGLLVPKLHLVAQHVYVQQFPHILFLIVLCAQRVRQLLGACKVSEHHSSRPGASSTDAHPPVTVLPDANFLRILPSSLLTRIFSCSLLEQLRMSAMKVCASAISPAPPETLDQNQARAGCAPVDPACSRASPWRPPAALVPCTGRSQA